MNDHSSTPVLLVRRSGPLERSAAALQDAGFEPVGLPLFDLVDTGINIPTGTYSAILITSEAALDILEARKSEGDLSTEALLSIPVFCVGDRTAAAADAFGFQTVVSASGSAPDLVERVYGAGLPSAAPLLYLTGEKRKPHIEAEFVAKGRDLKTVEVYSVRPREPEFSLIEQTFIKLASKPHPMIFLYSAEQSRWFFSLMTRHSSVHEGKIFQVVGISKDVFETISIPENFEIHYTNQPDEKAMIELAAALADAG